MAKDAARMHEDLFIVLRRLFSSPRGDGPAPARRMEILSALLRIGGGWWTADAVSQQLNLRTKTDRQELAGVLRDLRRCGILHWDEQALAYGLVEELRVPVALMLVACAPQTLAADQVQMLDRLVPFAQLAGRHDDRQAPVWALLDLVDRDLGRMDAMIADMEGGARRARDEQMLDQIAARLNGCSQELDRIRDGEMGEMVLPTIQRVSRVLERVSRLSRRMSATSRDHLRRRGSKLTYRQLRSLLSHLDDSQLAAGITVAAGPQITMLPGEGLLAALAPALDGDDQDQARAFPAQQDMVVEPLPLPEIPQVDPVTAVSELVHTAPPGPVIDTTIQFFSDRTWEEALRLQHGLLRLHSRHVTADQDIIDTHAERVTVHSGEVRWSTRIELRQPQLRLRDQRQEQQVLAA